MFQKTNNEFPFSFHEGYNKPHYFSLYNNNEINFELINSDNCISNIFIGTQDDIDKLAKKTHELINDYEHEFKNKDEFIFIALWKSTTKDLSMLGTFSYIELYESYFSQLSFNIEYQQISPNILLLASDIDSTSGPDLVMDNLEQDLEYGNITQESFLAIRDFFLDNITIKELEHVSQYFDIGDKINERKALLEKNQISENLNINFNNKNNI